MLSTQAIQQKKAILGAEMLRAISGKLDNTSIKHGCTIRRQNQQVANGYVSDNADYHEIEFAFDIESLTSLPSERAAMQQWLQYQKTRAGGREPNKHKRGTPVDWFRLGFASQQAALAFLGEFEKRRKYANSFTRWSYQGAPSANDRAELFPNPAQPGLATAEDEASVQPGPPSAAMEQAPPIGRDITDEATSMDGHQGNLSNQDHALGCITELIDHARRQTDGVMQTISYEELAWRLGRIDKSGNPVSRGMGDILARAMKHIDKTASSLGEQPPYLTTIVVFKSGKDKGLPGDGLRERWPGYDQLTPTAKSLRIEAEYQRILDFGDRWNAVLRALGLPPAAAAQTAPLALAGVHGWGGGESAEHKALKGYVSSHSELFGATANDTWHAFEEYGLRSGDSIDVFFEAPHEWIGVEVKSAVSEGNHMDYERGIFQVVKYHAVLTAQAKIQHPSHPPNVRVFLALDHGLPQDLRAVAQRLGVTVIEHLHRARPSIVVGPSAPPPRST
jgi:hypothetical protein